MLRIAWTAAVGTLLFAGAAAAEERAETLDAAAEALADALAARAGSGPVGVVRFHVPGRDLEEPGRTAAERAARRLTMGPGLPVFDPDTMDGAIASFGLSPADVDGGEVVDAAVEAGAASVLTGRLERVDCDGRLTGTLWDAGGSELGRAVLAFPLGGVPEALRPEGWAPCPTGAPEDPPPQDPPDTPEDPPDAPEDPPTSPEDPPRGPDAGAKKGFCTGCVRGEVRLGVRGGFAVRKGFASNATWSPDALPEEGAAPASIEEALAVAFEDLQPDTVALLGPGPAVGGALALDLYADVVRVALQWTFVTPTERPTTSASNDFGEAAVQARWMHALTVDAGVAFPFRVLRPWAGLRLGAQVLGARAEWLAEGSDATGTALADRSCAQEACAFDLSAKGFGIGLSGGVDLLVRDGFFVQLSGVFLFGPTLTEVGAGLALGWAPRVRRLRPGGSP